MAHQMELKDDISDGCYLIRGPWGQKMMSSQESLMP